MTDETTGTEHPNPQAQAGSEGATENEQQGEATAAKPEGGESGATTDAGNQDDKAKGEEGKAPEKPEGESEGVPEAYEAFSMPEGFQLEGERLEKFHELAKSSNWSQEQAQEAIDYFTTNVEESLRDKHAATVEAWAEDLKKDPEFGGQKYDTNLKTAAQAVNRFGGEPLIALLDELGIGNHPVLAKTFLAIGKATSEGGIDGLGSRADAAPKSLAERMYPGQKT